MNQELQRQAQEFAQMRAVQYVVHTPDTVSQFADLTARVVEQTEGACINMFMQMGIHGSVLTQLRENASYEPRQEPIAEVRISFPDRTIPRRNRGDFPELPNGFFERNYGDYQEIPDDYPAYLATVESFVNDLTQRRVVTSQEPPNRWSGEYWTTFHLNVNREPILEMSSVARIVSEALQHGVPLGETEQQPARMRFIRYNAGQGRVGTPAENGYVLMRQNDIYVVPTLGEFLMDGNDRVTRALDVPDRLCWFCDTDMAFRLDERLETTLSGQDLNGRRVFFVASVNRGDDSHDRLPNAIEMLERRGATIYATVDEASGLL